MVATVHDVKYLVRPEFFTDLSQLKRAYMRFSFAQTLQRTAAVITVSKATARDLQRLFKLDATCLHVVYEAASPEFQPAASDRSAELCERYGLTRPFIILSDANFRRRQITRGHEWFRGFTWERAAEQTVALYRRVLREMK